MQIWCKNSACRVLKNARPGRDDLAVLSLHLPKNGHAFGQIFLRDVEDFTLQEVTVSGLPDGIRAQCLLQGQVQFNDGVPYPDRLLPFASRRVAAHTAQGLWLAVAAAPYGMQPDARFKGDGYIVYPDTARGTVGFSARGLATLEGIEEYELLTLAAKDHPQAALALARGIARSFCDFCDEPDALELARIRLLSLCTAQG